MTKIAVIGLGAMGSRMAENLLKAGYELTVWNRTREAAAGLLAAGATQAATPREAVQGAAFVMSMVRDDAASRQVWLDENTGALAGMGSDAVAIESSTLTPAWIIELGAAAADKGIAFIEAPVAGSLPQAEAAQLIYLTGGDEAAVKRAEPILKTMGAAVHRVGPLGTGALAKLTTNTLLGIHVTVLAELIGMLKRSGADAQGVFDVVAATPVWSAGAQRLSGLMLSGNFAPQFPIELIAKDFDYALAVIGSPDKAPTIHAASRVFHEAIEQGLGAENMTGVVQLFSE